MLFRDIYSEHETIMESKGVITIKRCSGNFTFGGGRGVLAARGARRTLGMGEMFYF